MAYQNVDTPAFYIDFGLWQKALGILKVSNNTTIDEDLAEDLLSLSPQESREISLSGTETMSYSTNTHTNWINYIAFLGHRFSTDNISILDSSNSPLRYSLSDVVNCYRGKPKYDGFSIIDIDGGTLGEDISIKLQSQNAGTNISYLNAISFGRKFTMPFSPDIGLKQEYIYDGYTSQQTVGGSTLTNMAYRGNPKWGNQLGAWELDDAEGYAKGNLRSGRRSWEMTYSFLSDSQLFPTNSLGSFALENRDNLTEGSDYIDDSFDTKFRNNILSGSDFLSCVANFTMGGHLPFIFLPDSQNYNPDQWAICRFDLDSFSLTRAHLNTYNVSFRIIETW